MLSHSTGETSKQVTRVMEEDIVLKLKEKITCHKNELECFYTAAAAPGSRVVSLDTWKEGLSVLLPGRSRTAERRSTAALKPPFPSSSCALRSFSSFSAARLSAGLEDLPFIRYREELCGISLRPGRSDIG